jgi:hypothetical protein
MTPGAEGMTDEQRAETISAYEAMGFTHHPSADGALCFSRPARRTTTDAVKILRQEFVKGRPLMMFFVWWYGIVVRVEIVWYRLTHPRADW